MKKKEGLDVPVVLLIYKRHKKIKQIIEVISRSKPKKIYILSDGPSNESDREIIDLTRKNAEDSIDWECEVVKKYHDTNVGVYGNIGEGAKWIFSREKSAIFLEDDNLPEETFLQYSAELLNKYENNDRIFWVCGTNYLTEYNSGYSYMFSQHLYPCGWASWSDKFLKYYDGELLQFNDKNNEIFFNSHQNKKLAKQQLLHIRSEYDCFRSSSRPSSWDHQVEYSIRTNNLLGVSPSSNQIVNIGVDQFSTHGGSSKKNVMVDRFTSMGSSKLEFPLIHPNQITVDDEYERRIASIRQYPFSITVKLYVASALRSFFKIPSQISVKEFIVSKFLVSKNRK